MLTLAVNTYIHILFVITIFCCLIVELISIKSQLSYKEIKFLSKVDALYGVSAIAVVSTGILNWVYFGKGYDYYASNSFFIAKFLMFSIVGILSIYPTIAFFQLKKNAKFNSAQITENPKYLLIKKIIIIELIILTLIPLFAELMANGINY